MGVPWEGPEYNRVVYVILGNCCYFSGIERAGLGRYATSTINAAESIVQAIAEQEGIPVVALRWFDLQTYRGYRRRRGTYELDELTIGPTADLQPQQGGLTEIEIGGEQALFVTQDKQDFQVTGWRRTECPPEVLELFREYIGEPRVVDLGLMLADMSMGEYVLVERDENFYLLLCIAKSHLALNPDFAVAIVAPVGDGEHYTMWQKDETPP